jgi:uncharacterized peroxidase-related enzyme
VSRLNTCPEDSLQTETIAALEPVRQQGRLADVYLQFANSEAALRAYLVMEASLRSGSLSSADIEGIKLLVSELTLCRYCLAVHGMKARQAGLDADRQTAIRRGERTGDERQDAMFALVRALFTTPGVLDEALLQAARDAGITDTELVDITMAMSTIFFTNITNHINDTALTLSPAATQE